MCAAAVFPVTQRLAEFAASLRCEDLPESVRAQMGVLLIDFFRVAAVGAGTPWAARLKSALTPLAGEPLAAVLYSSYRTDPVRAAYLNGVIAGSLDWDDTHVGAMLHPGVVVWPAVLAVGEMQRSDGESLVAAAVAGYETMIRVGLSVQPSHFRRGFQSTPTCGVFGAAAAAARLLGLGAEATRDALGIAASYAGGLTQFFISGSEVKRLHAGKAAAGGVEAACEIVRQGVSPEEIEAVEVGIPAVIEGRLTNSDPADLQQAQMSVPFAVAMALTLTPERAWPPVLTLDDFERSLTDPRVRDLSRRTACVRDPEVERATTTEYVPARVTVRLHGGERRERAVWVPPGSPKRPMTAEEISARFRAVVSPLVSSATDLGAWLARARSPERLTGVHELMSLRAARSP